MTPAEFIGGPCDGVKMVLEDPVPTFYFFLKPELPYQFVKNELGATVAHRRAVYRRSLQEPNQYLFEGIYD